MSSRLSRFRLQTLRSKPNTWRNSLSLQGAGSSGTFRSRYKGCSSTDRYLPRVKGMAPSQGDFFMSAAGLRLPAA
eukprot:15430274-Alexandrium_andersonii.AAC.1